MSMVFEINERKVSRHLLILKKGLWVFNGRDHALQMEYINRSFIQIKPSNEKELATLFQLDNLEHYRKTVISAVEVRICSKVRRLWAV